MNARIEKIIAIVDENDMLVAVVRNTNRNEVYYSVDKLDQEGHLDLLNKMKPELPIIN